MRRRSLRWRIAVAVGLATAALAGLLALVLVRTVDERLHANARNEAVRALERAQLDVLIGRELPNQSTDQPGAPVIELFTQSLDGYDPLAELPAEQRRKVEAGETVVRRQTGIGGEPIYVAMSAVDDGRGGRVTLLAATPLALTERTIRTVRAASLVAVPALSLILAALAFVLVRRSLRPVDEMRTEADAISHGTLHRRLTPTAGSPELARLATTMNDMLGRLEQASVNQRRFASDASHELRSPLATIRAVAENAARRRDGWDGAAGAVIGEVDRLDRLVADLLALSRLDELGATRVEVDLDDVVRTHLARVTHLVGAVDGSGVEAVRVLADVAAIERTVGNLVDNAARHAKGRVRASVRRDGAHAVVVVEDDGPGVPVDQREHVFLRFARLDESRQREAGGGGLGLAVVAAAVAAHHGTVAIGDSTLGGARLEVRLPV